MYIFFTLNHDFIKKEENCTQFGGFFITDSRVIYNLFNSMFLEVINVNCIYCTTYRDLMKSNHEGISEINKLLSIQN